MYSVAGHKADPALKLSALTKPLPEHVRPAGTHAGPRMAAAMHLLLEDSPNGFVNCPQAWSCAMMGSAGLVFKQDGDNTYFLSLGCRSWMWAGLPLRLIEEGGHNFLSLDEHATVEFLSNFGFREDSKYKGVPTRVTLPSDSPPLVPGLSFFQTGPAEPLLPFAIKNGGHFIAEDLRTICRSLALVVVKLPNETVCRMLLCSWQSYTFSSNYLSCSRCAVFARRLHEIKKHVSVGEG
jgi:hypothetical protein